MNITKRVYKILRSILFTAILAVVGIYTLLYLFLSIPSVQQSIGDIAETELSKLLGTDIKIGDVSLSLKGGVVLKDVDVPCPDKSKFATIEKLGVGIDFWELIIHQKIVITYAEIIGLKGYLKQQEKNTPWNIQFLIDALSPKDKNKPPTKFDIKLRNVVIRSSAISVDKDWQKRKEGCFDINHLQISDIKADIILPQIKNDDFIVELRRLAFIEKSGFQLDRLVANVHITPQLLDITNLLVELPGTLIELGNFNLRYNGYGDIVNKLKNKEYEIYLNRARVTPSDFAAFYTDLSDFNQSMYLTLNAKYSPSRLNVNELLLDAKHYGLSLLLRGNLINRDESKREIAVKQLSLEACDGAIPKFLNLAPNISEKTRDIIVRLGDVKADLTGNLLFNKEAEFKTIISTSLGDVKASAVAQLAGFNPTALRANVLTSGFELGRLLDNAKFGTVMADVSTDISIDAFNIDGINGLVNLNVDRFDFGKSSIHNVVSNIKKNGKNVSGNVSVNMNNMTASVDGSGIIDGKNSVIEATLSTTNFNPNLFGISSVPPTYELSGIANVNIYGIDPNTLTGSLNLVDLDVLTPKGRFSVPYLTLQASNDKIIDKKLQRQITLNSPYVDADVTGNYNINKLPSVVRSLFAEAMPSVLQEKVSSEDYYEQDIAIDVTIKPDNTLPELFNLPIRLLAPVKLSGYLNGNQLAAKVNLYTPYLQQGKDKLIRNTYLNAQIEGLSKTVSMQAGTTLPGKDDTSVDVNLSLLGINDNLEAFVNWDLNRVKAYKGNVGMRISFAREPISNTPSFGLSVIPSHFQVADTTWNVAKGTINYSNKTIDVSGVSVSHADQFVNINGRASNNPEDKIVVDLSKIDLDYVFETLHINYVTFGGRATGRAYAANVFSPKEMIARTDGLKVQNLTYNGGLLGDDADLFGEFLPQENKVNIDAKIKDNGKQTAHVNGGIWIGRDSLSFDMATKKVNVQFLSPFLSAFASDLKGRASGHVKLYGTFSDIDLVGRVKADTISMKVDYTNVTYAGSDSVIIDPGKIKIPSFRLYDKNGNSGILTGELQHRYFHDPKFNFTIKEARNLLCYNTDASINPDWYGTIYGNGGGQIRGVPGYVGIMVDMDVAPKSTFTFVLNDRVAADDYDFLTFTDRRREMAEKEIKEIEVAKNDTIPDTVKAFLNKRKKAQQQENRPSAFELDLRATVSPSSEMILVMDPVGGDKIRAHGNGSMQLSYNSSSDELDMYGKYTLTEGLYNFTLQDIILKDFKIRPGSYIAFNGDPLRAVLGISANYRVNTNLTDLDKSFATDRELNRTNVPVDAVLNVRGDMQSPDITFDIELPSLSQDVVRKVKSIISTEDMMSRQIIYLLALNRFYTPEYMGSSGNGSEWASVASATVASQLQNMLSQLTDKFTLAPTFRTDKGDFSDVEVDVALSSRLLNNRLLINGNLGYRDKATSNTTFVGDFDIEYILNRRGNLSLKAYNHYNDQNYYLKSALTTQGVGIVYRKDFDNIFNFLKRRRKEDKDTLKNSEENQDSLFKVNNFDK